MSLPARLRLCPLLASPPTLWFGWIPLLTLLSWLPGSLPLLVTLPTLHAGRLRPLPIPARSRTLLRGRSTLLPLALLPFLTLSLLPLAFLTLSLLPLLSLLSLPLLSLPLLSLSLLSLPLLSLPLLPLSLLSLPLLALLPLSLLSLRLLSFFAALLSLLTLLFGLLALLTFSFALRGLLWLTFLLLLAPRVLLRQALLFGLLTFLIWPRRLL